MKHIIRLSILLTLFLATGVASAFLYFKPSFDLDLFVGHWAGSRVHDPQTRDMVSWETIIHEDGTFTSHSRYLLEGEELDPVLAQGTWWSDEYRFKVQIDERRKADGSSAGPSFENEFYHIELTESLHIYEHTDGTRYTAHRVRD